MTEGLPRRATNHRKASKNDTVDNEVTNSSCTVLYAMQVRRTKLPLRNTGSIKSIPMILNTAASLTRSSVEELE